VTAKLGSRLEAGGRRATRVLPSIGSAEAGVAECNNRLLAARWHGVWRARRRRAASPVITVLTVIH